MTDQRFREIQLTGKQLVFLFMASVVLAVAIFLLGVSVGRGVRGTTLASAERAPDSAGVVTVPDPMPPKTEASAADLGYHRQLQGPSAATTPPATGEAAPVPAAQTPAALPTPPAADRPAAPAGAGRSAPPPSAAPAAGKEAKEVWFIQTGAFGTRGNAEKQVGELKAKGHAASIVSSSTGPAFRVRLGPFGGRPEADRLRARLRAEGFTPSVTR